jgi:hypothetical protein
MGTFLRKSIAAAVVAAATSAVLPASAPNAVHAASTPQISFKV